MKEADKWQVKCDVWFVGVYDVWGHVGCVYVLTCANVGTHITYLEVDNLRCWSLLPTLLAAKSLV